MRWLRRWWRRRAWTPGQCPACGIFVATGDSCTAGPANAWSFGDEDFSDLIEPDDPPGMWTVDPDDRCHDCGVRVGGRHHAVCLASWCRVCGGQAVMCEHAS